MAVEELENVSLEKAHSLLQVWGSAQRCTRINSQQT